MSLNLNGDIYLKTPQTCESVTSAHCLSALGMPVLPGGASQQQTSQRRRLQTACSCAHRQSLELQPADTEIQEDFLGPGVCERYPASHSQIIFGHTLQYWVPGQHKEGQLLQCVIFSPQN